MSRHHDIHEKAKLIVHLVRWGFITKARSERAFAISLYDRKLVDADIRDAADKRHVELPDILFEDNRS